MSPQSLPLITMERVAVRVRDRRLLADTNWVIAAGQHWAVIGPNGAGKSTLVRVLIGDVPVVAGTIIRHSPTAAAAAIGYVSLEQHQDWVARDQEMGEARVFSGKNGVTIRVDDLLRSASGNLRSEAVRQAQVLRLLQIEPLRRRSLRHLSTGEMRRVLIARALLHNRGLLVLDEPFEGLDTAGRRLLSALLQDLMATGIQMILVTHRFDLIPAAVSHIIGLKDGQVVCQDTAARMLRPQAVARLYDAPKPLVALTTASKGGAAAARRERELIRICNASVAYDGITVFRNLSWRVMEGDNWAIRGPNGAGKTTLLRMISGDHPQAYANEIYLFGRRRGSGETIWEIKRRIGIVNSELQLNYRKPINAAEVVLSGFFDSIGLYRTATARQRRNAERWIAQLGLRVLAARPFVQLSYGQKRLVLIARAMVKSPQILILDEPCQGLDRFKRRQVLAMIDSIGTSTATQIIFVTHHDGDIPNCCNRFLDMQKGANG